LNAKKSNDITDGMWEYYARESMAADEAHRRRLPYVKTETDLNEDAHSRQMRCLLLRGHVQVDGCSCSVCRVPKGQYQGPWYQREDTVYFKDGRNPIIAE